MSRPVWFVNLIKRSFRYRALAARATRLPLVGWLAERWLFHGDDLIYLPRDRVIPVGQAITAPDSVVLPSQVVTHFVMQAQTLWVMNTCLCRDASGCQSYPVDLGCLFLGRPAQGINPRLGRPVSREEALDHVRRCREAGLVHLVGRNRLDTVWLGVGPVDKLVTICSCCPCCCLYTVLPQISEAISARISRMPGVRVVVNDQCAGCGACTEGVCFVDAIHLDDGRAVISEACRGCGHCALVCPQGAIEVRIEDSSFVDETIRRITSVVDLSEGSS